MVKDEYNSLTQLKKEKYNGYFEKHDESEEIQLKLNLLKMKRRFSLLIKNSSKEFDDHSFVSPDKIQSAMLCCKDLMGKIYTTIKDYCLSIKEP